ncbi:lecithin retinol acyltransferase family protein [Cupriavidus sp. IDO]|uniref:lecithin retinol acyltransferase family protein n=1 Tax=Cupriavidus sp. IDO TaxID=1539142 RepID=UPI00057966BB|nr:lecithin retinol acyltransferase family protein [Cupriavidus sp. IDO]KWR91577.1 hydrolase [Cupriavidus sp. IDO]
MDQPTRDQGRTANTVLTHRALDAGTEPPLGAHLLTPRNGYSHHGIYVGDGKVVHYAGLAGSLRRGPVEEVSITRFAAGYEVLLVPSADPVYARHEAVRRARSRLGENHYRLLTNNCEHFCAWCLYGESRSEQVLACFIDPRAAIRTALCLFAAFLAAAWPMGRTGPCVS